MNLEVIQHMQLVVFFTWVVPETHHQIDVAAANSFWSANSAPFGLLYNREVIDVLFGLSARVFPVTFLTWWLFYIADVRESTEVTRKKETYC